MVPLSHHHHHRRYYHGDNVPITVFALRGDAKSFNSTAVKKINGRRTEIASCQIFLPAHSEFSV